VRQVGFFLRQSGVRFLLAIPRVLTVLREEPRLAVLLTDMLDEVRTELERVAAEDDRLFAAAVEIREQIGGLAPDLEDAHRRMTEGDARRRIGLLAFDDLRAVDVVPALFLDPQKAQQRGRAGSALQILADVLESARRPDGDGPPRRPELDDLPRQVGNLQREWRASSRRHRVAVEALPGVSLTRLEWADYYVDEPPEIVPAGQEALDAWADRQFRRYGSDEDLLQKALFDPVPIDDPFGDQHESHRFTEMIDRLRHDVEQVQEELLRRIGTVRSRRAIVERFKVRAEWHDRERLRQLGAEPRHGEARLRDELARFLFDAGLNPVTEVVLGNVRADIVAVATPTLYVEAKQYQRGERKVVTDAMKQIWDTAGRLTEEPYKIREAFLVIFRRGGRRVQLPEHVPGFGITVYLVLIDIGDAAQTGSRQRAAPLVITAEELAPTAT